MVQTDRLLTIWNWDLMNKGLRQKINIIPFDSRTIWNWDLMNKGLRHCVSFPDFSKYFIWNWDLMNKGLRLFIIKNLIEPCFIWNWDLMNKGLRPFSNTAIFTDYFISETETWWIRDWDSSRNVRWIVPFLKSETETWWIRDWDRFHTLPFSMALNNIWNWDLMNKGLRRVLISIHRDFYKNLKLRPDE